MTEILAFLAFILLCGLVKILNITSPSLPPNLYLKDRSSAFVQNILAACPIFLEAYVPPLIWGKCGHLQTLVYVKMGRVMLPVTEGQRHHKVMPDGATMTFDIYEPKRDHKKGDFTALVCPGFGNSSESPYIRTLVDYFQQKGYRLAVLNHLGALADVKLTSPRIFNYGCTDEFGMMVEEILRLYPQTKLLAMGFSMGANIVVKYLGESKLNQTKFICGMSICQGYDVNQAKPLLMEWENLRRAYVFFMTENMKLLLRKNYSILFGEDAKKLYGPVDVDKIFSSTSLVELDENFSSQRAGFSNHVDYYTWASCRHVMNNIDIPMFVLNAEDDPLVPSVLQETAKRYAATHDKCIFAVTKHGGHLGHFEGGIMTPAPITWLDRAVLQFADAITMME
ncbi:monoacylglycerol lipase ABHD2-like isoform X2 [Gigantopelta aegis]|uniref:monoacylglycerol lipase ABHD2-like isoform X2 n=1 Tax=Gigantopelta aegis TaxID=1735272 RepID=UPI001B8887EC|nr:monoacylglycerol lipase ABHD2-like isoform X2 [Gigantopelta aegis]